MRPDCLAAGEEHERSEDLRVHHPTTEHPAQGPRLPQLPGAGGTAGFPRLCSLARREAGPF